jgi:hypothetical protein
MLYSHSEERLRSPSVILIRMVGAGGPQVGRFITAGCSMSVHSHTKQVGQGAGQRRVGAHKQAWQRTCKPTATGTPARLSSPDLIPGQGVGGRRPPVGREAHHGQAAQQQGNPMRQHSSETQSSLGKGK